jgi:PAS domain S-box-containing protein
MKADVIDDDPVGVQSRNPQLDDANRQLREANAQFQAMWEQGLFAGRLDLNGVVMDANRASVEDCGFTRDQIIGRPFWECGWWKGSLQVQEWIRGAVQRAVAGQAFRGESRYWVADGSERVVDFACIPIQDAEDQVIFVVPTGMDITERVEAERNRRAYAEERQRAEEAKGTLEEAEDRFQSFANSAPAMLWLAGADGACLFFSRAWCDYTGQSANAALGFGWLEAVHPDEREECRRGFLEAYRQREAFSMDCRVRRADGEFRWVLNAGRPRFNPSGDFAGFAGSVIDIHDRKESAQASALLAAIVDSCDDAIISKDLTGVITSWNQGAERLFGYTAEEAIGQSVLMLIPLDRQQEEPGILAQLRRGERVDHYETIRLRKDGSERRVSLTISPVKDSDGRVIGASKVARDVTERARHQQQMLEANAALRRANADLQQFAYSASHDLQEPLRMVSAYSELLRKKFGGKLGATGDEYIGHAVEGAMRMQSLLRDLRTYTQVSTEDQDPPGEIDAGEALNRTLRSLQVVIEKSGAAISRTELPRVRMLEFQLEQIFQNLIGNAINYRGEEPPRIHIAGRREGGDWLFSVQDNGIGIDPQFKEQVFGIFKRLHSASEHPGTGMGLAICQRIVERAGGRIWVDSEPGRGSTFYFTVPRGEP